MQAIQTSPRLLRPELRDYFDKADNIAIQFRQVFGRNPEFLMDSCAYRLNRILRQELSTYCETRDISGATFTDIPVPRNLASVLLIENGIENRLFRQPGRELSISALGDEREFFRTHGPIQDCPFRFHALTLPLMTAPFGADFLQTQST